MLHSSIRAKGVSDEMEHNKVRDGVRFLLEAYPETCNNDNLLCVMYWKIIDGIQSLDGIEFATSSEAIRRARQLVNERGIGLATDPDVLKRRKQFKKKKE